MRFASRTIPKSTYGAAVLRKSRKGTTQLLLGAINNTSLRNRNQFSAFSSYWTSSANSKFTHTPTSCSFSFYQYGTLVVELISTAAVLCNDLSCSHWSLYTMQPPNFLCSQQNFAQPNLPGSSNAPILEMHDIEKWKKTQFVLSNFP